VEMRKRKKWLVLLLGAGVLALYPEIDVYGHYMAPFTAILLILIVAAGRVAWYRIGASRARGLAFVSVLIALLLPLAANYMGALEKRPTERGRFIQRLTAEGGRHLVFVDYSGHWNAGYEWVYNGADLDASPVIFAHMRSPQENRELVNRFPGRKVWLARLGPELSNLHVEEYSPLFAASY